MKIKFLMLLGLLFFSSITLSGVQVDLSEGDIVSVPRTGGGVSIGTIESIKRGRALVVWEEREIKKSKEMPLDTLVKLFKKGERVFFLDAHGDKTYGRIISISDNNARVGLEKIKRIKVLPVSSLKQAEAASPITARLLPNLPISIKGDMAKGANTFLLAPICEYTLDNYIRPQWSQYKKDYKEMGIKDFAQFKKSQCKSMPKMDIKFQSFFVSFYPPAPDTLDDSCFKLHLNMHEHWSFWRDVIYPAFISAFLQLGDKSSMFKILRPIDGPFLDHLDEFSRILGVIDAPADYTQRGKVVTIYFNRNNWKSIIKFAGILDQQIKIQLKKYQLKFGQEGLKESFLNAPFEKRLVLPSWKNTAWEKVLSIRYGVCNSMLGNKVKIYDFRKGKYTEKMIFYQEDDRKNSFPEKLQVPKELMQLVR